MSAIASLSRLFSRTDEEAMGLVKERDDHAEFARLLKRWEEPIRRLCTRMIGDPDRGDDLKQDIFVRLFANRKAYAPRSRFSTFLWRIALNRCYDELRRQKRRQEFLHPDPHEISSVPAEQCSDGFAPDVQAACKEEGELVRQAVLSLPDIYRAVIVLRHYEGLKLSSIAEILEIPEGTVNSRMAEALDRLSRVLSPRLKEAPSAGRNPPARYPLSNSKTVKEAFL
jgi:RNA polymerase sigma-70 factor, ECF subfamily